MEDDNWELLSESMKIERRERMYLENLESDMLNGTFSCAAPQPKWTDADILFAEWKEPDPEYPRGI